MAVLSSLPVGLSLTARLAVVIAATVRSGTLANQRPYSGEKDVVARVIPEQFAIFGLKGDASEFFRNISN